MAKQRITKALRVLNKENVVAILVIGGFSVESAEAKVEAGYDMAIKCLPNDDAKGVAQYIACCF